MDNEDDDAFDPQEPEALEASGENAEPNLPPHTLPMDEALPEPPVSSEPAAPVVPAPAVAPALPAPSGHGLRFLKGPRWTIIQHFLLELNSRLYVHHHNYIGSSIDDICFI